MDHKGDFWPFFVFWHLEVFRLFLGLKIEKNWKNDIFFDFICVLAKKIEKSYVKISNVHQLFKNNFLGFWPIDGANWVKMRSNPQIRMRLIPLNPKHSKTPIYLKNSTRYCDLSNVKYDILTFKIWENTKNHVKSKLFKIQKRPTHQGGLIFEDGDDGV